MPDGWFNQKEEVPYLFLSANPWACYCSLGYLREYLDDFESNIYVREVNGESDFKTAVERVVSTAGRVCSLVQHLVLVGPRSITETMMHSYDL